MNIATLAIHASDEAGDQHVKMADEAVDLGNGDLRDTYLNIPKIVNIAREHHVDGLHPGYGLLSENPIFAEKVMEAGIRFIGPSPGVIRLMGDKLEALRFARRHDVPTLENFTGSPDELLKKLGGIELPVLIKSAGGGGGKGMRVLRVRDEAAELFATTSREALSSFGNGNIYIEKFLQDPRHVEVQVLGDEHGNLIHLLERECSLQRRNQKIIEEAPSDGIDGPTRQKLHAYALQLARAAAYTNAGTIEFLVDRKGNVYFLEMNTRLQVEHPVTEMITGIDIVEQQIKIAAGEKLNLQQGDIIPTGHAIEARLYAEDPEHGFLPSPGNILHVKWPGLPGIRVETYFDGPTRVMSHYDPMIAKIISHGKDREQARLELMKALEKTAILGVKTNKEFLFDLLSNKAVAQNNISTSFVETGIETILNKTGYNKEKHLFPLLGAAIILLFHGNERNMKTGNIWHQLGFWRILMKRKFMVDEEQYSIVIDSWNNKDLIITDGSSSRAFSDVEVDKNHVAFMYNGQKYEGIHARDDTGGILLGLFNKIFKIRANDVPVDTSEPLSGGKEGQPGQNGEIKAPVHGKVVKINVKKDQKVKKGDGLLVLESMKLENKILAEKDAEIESVIVEEGQQVETNKLLIKLKE
jgi:acetyl/propionyl-CoA carboxylase alpha subunit